MLKSNRSCNNVAQFVQSRYSFLPRFARHLTVLQDEVAHRYALGRERLMHRGNKYEICAMGVRW